MAAIKSKTGYDLYVVRDTSRKIVVLSLIFCLYQRMKTKWIYPWLRTGWKTVVQTISSLLCPQAAQKEAFAVRYGLPQFSHGGP